MLIYMVYWNQFITCQYLIKIYLNMKKSVFKRNCYQVFWLMCSFIHIWLFWNEDVDTSQTNLGLNRLSCSKSLVKEIQISFPFEQHKDYFLKKFSSFNSNIYINIYRKYFLINSVDVINSICELCLTRYYNFAKMFCYFSEP